MAIATKMPLTDATDMYLNMKLETSQKRHLYEESKWAVKEIDLMEDKRKLELRVVLLEQEVDMVRMEVDGMFGKVQHAQDKVGTMQGQIRLLSEEKDRMNRDALSVQKQLDYYKNETESLQKRMKDADNVLSEKMALTRQVISLQLELENERRATVRTSKNAADKGDSEKSLQKEITELKSQLSKQTQLTEKAKSETLKTKEDWEKQKSVLETKLEKEKSKNKNLQEKKTGLKRKASDEEVAPPLLSPMKPIAAPKTVSVAAPPPALRKPIAKKTQPAVSEFSTTPFFARQGSVMPQPSPTHAANTSIMGRSMPVFGGSKSKRATSVATRVEDTVDSITLDEETSIADVTMNTSVLDAAGIPKKKKRKLNGTGNRTLLAAPDESPAHGLNEFGLSALMLESPATRPKFGGNHLLSTLKKPKGGLLWNLKKGGLKLDKNAVASPEKGSDKMKDIKRGFTLKL